MRWRFGLLFLFSVLGAAQTGYLGREVCASCHKEIATKQAQTAMASTWQGTTPQQIPVNSQEKYAEGPDPEIDYLIQRTAGKLSFEVRLPAQQPVQFPIEITMGGKRHGLSFLARVANLDGLPLARAPLVETRYLHYAPENRLELSPGFPKDKPTTYETAIGRVLTPHFEEKCLACHGAPRAARGTHLDTGVTCESCHGPGHAHLAALANKPGERGILDPGRLPVAEQMNTCAQCHAGFSKVVDPMPDDLLISDQVTALSNSECWRQTAGQITCVNCHSPHQDLARAALVAQSEKTCLGCHVASVAQHPALCPLNRSTGCVGCHMPDSKTGAPFIISDHWIRVHPEQNVAVPPHSPQWASQQTPKHLFLRLMVFDDQAKATAAHDQLLAGASFFQLARADSIDRSTAINGGYLGDLAASALDPAWAQAALSLRQGDVSAVMPGAGRFFIVGRMPRNFREDAEARFNQAMELRKAGNRQAAAAELLEALKLDPRLLRALTYLGVTYAEAGNPQLGAGILNVAIHYYPQDAGAHFNLGVAEGALANSDEIDQYKKALAIDPDYVPAYLNWGAALFLKGQYDEAIGIYRKGIAVDPLEASLHYSLSLALERVNKSQEARAEQSLALKIDPKAGGQQ